MTQIEDIITDQNLVNNIFIKYEQALIIPTKYIENIEHKYSNILCNIETINVYHY